MKSKEIRLLSTRISVKNSRHRPPFTGEAGPRAEPETSSRQRGRSLPPQGDHSRRRPAARTRSPPSRTGTRRSRAPEACWRTATASETGRETGLVSRKKSQPPIISTNVSAIWTAAQRPRPTLGQAEQRAERAGQRDQRAVVQAPQHEVPARPMPEAGEDKRRQRRWSRAAATARGCRPAGCRRSRETRWTARCASAARSRSGCARCRDD